MVGEGVGEDVGCGVVVGEDVEGFAAEALGKAAPGEAAGCVAVVTAPVEEEFAVLFEKENPDCKLETVKVFA